MSLLRNLASVWMLITLAVAGGCGGDDGSSTAAPAVLTGIQITPAAVSRPVGINQPYVATGTYSDGHTQIITASVTWKSGDPTKATIGDLGVAKTLAQGATAITALSGVVASNSATLTVTAAELVSIQTTPAVASRPAGLTQQYQATGTYTDGTAVDLTGTVAWASSVRTVATVGAGGLANAITAGQASVSATLDGISSGTAVLTVTGSTLVSLQITPPAASKTVGVSQQYAATGTFSDGTTQDLSSSVVWSSSDTTKATLGQTGLATTLAPGTAFVTATRSGLTSNVASLVVAPAQVVSVRITPTVVAKAAGHPQQYAAMADFTDGRTIDVTTSAGWNSTDASKVTIDAAGLATSVAVGNAGITATLNGVRSDVGTFTVTTAQLTSIQIAPGAVVKAAGTTAQYTATGYYTDNRSQDLTATVAWSSSDTGKATVTPAGLATAVAAGTSTIRAVLSGIQSNTSGFTTTAATLVSIQITPPAASRAAGTTQRYTATGTYTDRSTQDLSNQVSWVSSRVNIATISASGLATGVARGAVDITGAHQGVQSNTAVFTVTAATLASIQVTPAAASVAAGLTQQYAATGTYTDGTTRT